MTLRKTNKKKFILSTSCTLLAVVTAGVAVMSTTQTALAKATLPGVEKIIQGNGTDNPFVILEIVPEKEDAALGYFVAGEEPVDASGKSIKDMPSKEEREARFNNASTDDTAVNRIASLGIGDAVSYFEYEETISASDTERRTVDIRGVFSEDTEGDYAEKTATEQYTKIEIVAEDPENPADNLLGYYTLEEIQDKELYRRYMSFHRGDDGLSKYAGRYRESAD